MKNIVFVLVIVVTATGCVSVTPAGEMVRITTNPDVVQECEFLENVSATSGWGGPGGTGLGSSNTEKTLKNDTAELGGDTLFLTSSGVHASGEAYKCRSAK